jgi:hypothetical protein
MEFEYSILHYTGTLDPLGPQIADPSNESFAAAFQHTFLHLQDRLHADLQEHRGGGWDIVSHDLIRIDRFLLVTFVVRRPQEAG